MLKFQHTWVNSSHSNQFWPTFWFNTCFPLNLGIWFYNLNRKWNLHVWILFYLYPNDEHLESHLNVQFLYYLDKLVVLWVIFQSDLKFSLHSKSWFTHQSIVDLQIWDWCNNYSLKVVLKRLKYKTDDSLSWHVKAISLFISPINRQKGKYEGYKMLISNDIFV